MDKLNHELNRMVTVLSSDSTVQRVVLFGSMAQGTANEDSDLDLLVIQDTELAYFKRLKAML